MNQLSLYDNTEEIEPDYDPDWENQEEDALLEWEDDPFVCSGELGDLYA